MNKFVVQVVCFLALAGLVVAALLGTSLFILSKASFQIDAGKNILVLGDSFTEMAIDDNILARSTNLSQSATAHLYSYAKLKKILENNPQIDTVLLSFQYLSLTRGQGDLWLDGDEFLTPKFTANVSLLEKEEWTAFSDKPAVFSALLKVPVRDAYAISKYLTQFRISYRDLNIGSFYAIDRQTLQQSIDGYYSPENVLSARQEVFLQKIARYCSGRNVKLILISTPVFQPEKYGNIELLTAYHQKYLPDVDWLNYSGFVLPDSCFWAVDHLNYRGAIIFSRYLQETFGQKAGHNLQHIKE